MNPIQLRRIIDLSWPILTTFVLSNSISLVAIAFVGQIGTKELAAATLGSMFANVMGISFGIGFASAMDTLCTQAYGSKNFFMLGVLCQRGILILGVLSIPLSLVWLSIESILLAMGQDPVIAHYTGQYMRYQLPGLYPQFVYTILNKYIQTQGVTRPAMYITAVIAAMNPFLCYLFIYQWSFGYLGAALAVAVGRMLLPVLLGTYIYTSGIYKSTWNGWTRDCLREWKIFIELGTPGCIMVCSEWWAAEFLTLAAGWISTSSLDAQAIIANVNGILFSLPLALCIAGTIEIGHKLGANEPREARLTWITMVGITSVGALGLIALVFAFRHTWPYWFTTDEDIVALVTSLLPYLCLYVFVDALQSIAAGVLRGCGLQSFGAYCNLVSYYCVGIPLGLYLAFSRGHGLYGLWMGNSVANICQCLSVVTMCCRLDWQEEAHLAQVRIRKQVCALDETFPQSPAHRLPAVALTPNGSKVSATFANC